MNTKFQRFLSERVLPMWTILLIDIFIIVLSTLFTYAFRYNFNSVFLVSYTIDKTILWAIVTNLIFFCVFRTYSGVLRFSSFVDVMRLFVSLSFAYGTLSLIRVCLRHVDPVFRIAPIPILFTSYFISLSMMVCFRVFVKTFFETMNINGIRSDNIFIYGAKEAGVNIAKSLRANPNNRYRLRGFIADEPELVGKVMMGVKVYPNNDLLPDVLRNRNVQTIVVSPAKMEELKCSKTLDLLLEHKIKLMSSHPLSEYGEDTEHKQQLKDVQIEDLLRRKPIVIDTRSIASMLQDKCVLITGAAGSIGSEIMRQVALFNPAKLILIDQAETPLHDIRLEIKERFTNVKTETILASISNVTRMEEIFKQFKPQYVFHAAAYKHVPMMEDNVSESIQVNVFGTRTMADLAVKYGVEKFVMISTDKAVNPSNVMGCSKRICEIYVQSLARKLEKEGRKNATQFVTTRFGNVLGSNGSVIPLFREQIRRGGPVTVTHKDIIRYFMTIPEACRLVLEAGCMGHGGEIFIFDMGEPVKIWDLAQRMIHLSGHTTEEIKIKETGLRPGEKLYEELLNDKEKTKPTSHDKIMIATVREYDYDEVKERIQQLIDLSYTYDAEKIVAMMKEIVPEFLSKNSPLYEGLDKRNN